jgi:hypothetical protein
MSITLRRRRASLPALAFAFLLAACIAASTAHARPADFRTTYQPVPAAYSSDAGPGAVAVSPSSPATPVSGSTDDGSPWLAIVLAAGIPLALLAGGVSITRHRAHQRHVGLAA